MHRNRKAVGLASAALAAAGLVTASTGAALGAPHATHQAATHHAKYAKTPTLKVTVKNTGTADNPTFAGTFSRHRLRAGQVKVVVHTTNTAAEVGFLSFKKGYSFHDYITDLKTFAQSQNPDTGQFSAAGLRAWRHAVRHTHYLGGLAANNPGDTSKGTLNLAPRGRVYVVNDAVDGPPVALGKLKITGPSAHRRTPAFGGTVKAMTDKNDQSRFAGDKRLPHRGVIRFLDTRTSTTPHFLVMLHVKEGTTKKQVEEYFNSNTQGPPSFALPGEADTDAVSPGHSMTVHVNQPRGQYVQLCFFSDLKTGMPHAFMGMIRMVHLV